MGKNNRITRSIRMGLGMSLLVSVVSCRTKHKNEGSKLKANWEVPASSRVVAANGPTDSPPTEREHEPGLPPAVAIPSPPLPDDEEALVKPPPPPAASFGPPRQEQGGVGYDADPGVVLPHQPAPLGPRVAVADPVPATHEASAEQEELPVGEKPGSEAAPQEQEQVVATPEQEELPVDEKPGSETASQEQEQVVATPKKPVAGVEPVEPVSLVKKEEKLPQPAPPLANGFMQKILRYIGKEETSEEEKTYKEAKRAHKVAVEHLERLKELKTAKEVIGSAERKLRERTLQLEEAKKRLENSKEKVGP